MSRARERASREGTSPVKIGTTQLNTDSGDLKVTDTSNNLKKIVADEVHIGDSSNKVIIKKGSDNKVQFQTQASGSSAADSNAGGGVTVYANISAMTSASASVGDQALVTANSGLYVHNGGGWYKVATINTSPTISSPNTGANVTMGTDGNPTSIELVGADVDEGTTLQNSYAVTSGSLTNGGGTTATITTSATSGGTYSALAAGANTTNRFFKITPTTNSSYAGAFTLTFSMSDSINAATTVQNFSLQFAVSGSMYFDGTGDYISVAKTTDLEPGSGDFSLEFWAVYTADSFSSYSCMFSNNFAIQFYLDNGMPEVFFSTNGDGAAYFGKLDADTAITGYNGSQVSRNVWYHYAITRSGNTFRLFINGYEAASSTSSNAIGVPASLGVSIGNLGVGSSYLFEGYISNVRFIKGSATYTGNFTPSTTPLTSISNTKLLVAANADRVDSIGGSISFPGTSGQVMYAAESSKFQLGTGDWTIEGWVYLTSGSDNNGFWQVGASGSVGFQSNYTTSVSLVMASATTLKLYGAGGEYNLGVANSAVPNAWTHYAMTKYSNTLKIYKNGTEIYSRGDTTNYANDSLGIGSTYDSTQTPIFKLNNFRVVKGTAVYTGNFTPPTGNLTATGGSYSSTTNVNTSIPSGHTSIILGQQSSGTLTDTSGNSHSLTISNRVVSNYDNPFASPTSDSTTPSHALTFNGDSRFSHVTPFTSPTTGSTDFNGATGTSNNGFTYLDSPVDSAVAPGSGDFTIEYWIYSRDISAGTQMPFDYNYSTAGGIMMYINTTGRLVAHTSSILLLNDGTGSAPEMASNIWYHVALVRHNSELRMYQNGIMCTNTAGYGSQDGSHPFSTNLTQTRITIGVKYFGGHDTYPVDGSISNFRLVVGTAVYTGDSSFTPPTSPLTAITNTQLLTCQNSTGTIADASSNNLTMVVGSGAVASKHNPF